MCHNVPVVGGGGIIAELRAAAATPTGEFEPLHASGETLFQLFSVPGHGCQPIVPAEATVFARRVPIPLFGAGLVEAIPDETAARARGSDTIATATASAGVPRA